MADIEYPFLYFLRDIGMKFALLNPSGGTVSRCIKVFPEPIPIFVTCMEDELFDKYEEGLKMHMFGSGWSLQQCSTIRLPNLIYYGGFTASKLIDKKKVFGYELNPKSVVMSYDGEYKYKSFPDHDNIVVVRNKDYVYEEDYYFDPKYYRYEADFVKDFFKNKEGFFNRTYPFMYNIISSFSLDFFESCTSFSHGGALQSLVGYHITGGMVSSPYDRRQNDVSGVSEFVVEDKSIMMVRNLSDIDVLGFTSVCESVPPKHSDYVSYHFSELEKSILIEPRQEYCGDDYVLKDRRKILMDHVGYDEAILKWRKYKIDISTSYKRHFMLNHVECLVFSPIYKDCKFVIHASPHNAPVFFVPPHNDILYYFHGNSLEIKRKWNYISEEDYQLKKSALADRRKKEMSMKRKQKKKTKNHINVLDDYHNRVFIYNGNFVKPRIKLKDRKWKNQFGEELTVYSMIRDENGPLVLSGSAFVPFPWHTNGLMKWHLHMRKHPTLFYYMNNEYVVLKSRPDEYVLNEANFYEVDIT